MLLYSILVFVHVLLFVFWLGTDVGVFLAAKISERSDLGTETRATVLKLGMVLEWRKERGVHGLVHYRYSHDDQASTRVSP